MLILFQLSSLGDGTEEWDQPLISIATKAMARINISSWVWVTLHVFFSEAKFLKTSDWYFQLLLKQKNQNLPNCLLSKRHLKTVHSFTLKAQKVIYKSMHIHNLKKIVWAYFLRATIHKFYMLEVGTGVTNTTWLIHWSGYSRNVLLHLQKRADATQFRSHEQDVGVAQQSSLLPWNHFRFLVGGFWGVFLACFFFLMPGKIKAISMKYFF